MLKKFFENLKKHIASLVHLLIYCVVQHRVTSHQSRVHDVEELLDIWHGIQQSAQLMESASSRLRTGQRR